MTSSTTSLPPMAQERIASHAQGGGPAASFSEYGDYVMLADMGFEPVGAAVGLSCVHIGRPQLTGIKNPMELETYSKALTLGILNALGRLQEEGRLLGADGVMLQSIEKTNYDLEEHEYTVKGTALRFTPQPGAFHTSAGVPFICPASVMTMYQMLRRGMAPVALGYGVCVYHVPHRTMRQAISQTFQNLEVPVFTEGWYTAREIALSKLEHQLVSLGSDLILNLSLQHEAEAFGEHTSEFRAVGAGWARKPEASQLVPEINLVAPSLIERGSLYTTSSV
jgi:uncharacterized protein YbjQ (UPF0145 family)